MLVRKLVLPLLRNRFLAISQPIMEDTVGKPTVTVGKSAVTVGKSTAPLVKY